MRPRCRVIGVNEIADFRKKLVAQFFRCLMVETWLCIALAGDARTSINFGTVEAADVFSDGVFTRPF